MNKRNMLQDMMNRMENTFQEFEKEFDKQMGGMNKQLPIDVRETEENVIVKADLPGVDKDSISITSTDQHLEIEARDEHEVAEEGQNYFKQERQSKHYHRQISLPTLVEPDSAEATYQNGVLTVSLAKSEESMGTDIEVK